MNAHSVELLTPAVATACGTPQVGAGPKGFAPELVQIVDGRASGLGLASLGMDCLQRLVSAPELLLAGARTWMKNQPGHRVAFVDSESEAAPGMWCCKERTTRSRWVRFAAAWTSIRAHNAFRQGLALLRAQVNTPLPLAVVAVTRCGEYHEYLLTEAIPDAVSLQTWLGTRGQSSSTSALRETSDLSRQLGLQLQRLHAHGFDHRDLKPTNVLIAESSGRSSVWLIDLDGVWQWPWIPAPRRVQNLARLWAGVAGLDGVTATDALRFLLSYLMPDQRRNWKTLWRRVAKRAAAKIRERRVVEKSSSLDSRKFSHSLGEVQKS